MPLLNELRAEFNTLKTSAGDDDPVRLRYIESLLNKAEQRAGRQAQILEQKVRDAMCAYRTQNTAHQSIAPRPSQSHDQLRALNKTLEDLHRDEHDHRAAPLEAALRQQELDLVEDISGQAITGKQAPARREELKAARRFHSAMVEFNADNVVNQALAEVPEECGPLNPQRLATRSLATMRDLSPHYLSRFVSYIDTLFWLEQAEKSTKR
jgi:Protein of unknown function (DUF2894)